MQSFSRLGALAAALAALATTAFFPHESLAQTAVRQPPGVYPACAATALSAACDPTTGCAPRPNTGAALVVDGGGVGGPRAVVLGGDARYTTVTVRNCGRVYVRPYNGNRNTSGVLRLIATSINVDATSAIVADGAGYVPDLCRDGYGPNLPTNPSTPAGDPTGGKGGCRVSDSAGGGGHFGPGGRGTKDCSNGCTFPADYEQACTGALPGTSLTGSPPGVCPSTTSCRANDGRLSDAGPSYFHAIYTLEMGAAGGDAGCRDGDGWESAHATATQYHGVGGFGGGGIALVGLSPTGTGSVTLNGYVVARGGRGCAWDNDSGGGGAGGSILVVGDTVTVGDTAVVSAEGGPGGSGVSTGGGRAWWNACGTSNSSICDDCGGGGGGGIINVQSRAANLSTRAFFLAGGGPGGGNFDGCTVCQGGAGGGAGEVQLDGAYVGELCDGFDNDFDGMTDESLGNVSCGLGACQTSTAACTAGVPASCAPATSDPTCYGTRGTSRPRVAVVLDSSGSMLWNLAGTPTFGDGSTDHPGIDLDNNGRADDSRLFLAKGALSELISAYPEIDFALARYHQDEGVDRSCQTAKWFECQGNCCSYDNPNNGLGTSPVACQLALPRPGGGTVNLTVRDDSPTTNHCINYAGTCGAPRRGADILVGFESDVRQYLRWLDGHENGFDPTATPGAYCNGLAGDCELRGSGPTPLAGSLQALYDYVTPIKTEDPAAACRGYSVILVSDGGEDCNGNPAAAAAALLAANIRTYVIGVSVNAAEGATLNSIAMAGGTGAFIPVNSPDQLLPALTGIVSGSIRTEICNGLDDNCNGETDEGFNVGAPCDNGLQGACRGTGHLACNPANAQTTVCQVDAGGGAATAEVCNGLDDDCNGLVDENNPGGGGACGNAEGECTQGTLRCQGGTLVCAGGTGPAPEACNGLDDDCNGQTDEGVPPGGPCGSSVGECRPGTFVCRGEMGYVCEGATPGGPEVCDGLDNDCNGAVDDNVPGTGEPCGTDAQGNALCHPGVVRCVQGALRCQGGTPFHPAECTCHPDDCAVSTGDGGGGVCPTGSACLLCACRTACRPGEFPCSGNLVCRDGYCVPPECGGRICADNEDCVNDACVDRCTLITCPGGRVCRNGSCVENDCYAAGCPAGQVCRATGCIPDPCAGVHCAADQFCIEGACRTTCEGVSCAAGTSCHDGRCASDPCGGVQCPAGQVCVPDGSGNVDAGAGGHHCASDPCTNVACGTGRVCANGRCVDDPCANVTCPGDPSAVVCRGGECVPRDSGPPPDAGNPDRVVATGSNPFGCNAGPGNGALDDRAGVGLSLLGLALASALRRRANRGGAR